MDLFNVPHLLTERTEPKKNRERRRNRTRQEQAQHASKNKINKFIEIGPGKVLSGLIKRIDKNVTTSSVNNEEDINKININD